jgi:hypothetical protein
MRSSEISIAVRPESKIKYPITTRFDGVHFDIRHFIFFFIPKETIPAPTSKSVSNLAMHSLLVSVIWGKFDNEVTMDNSPARLTTSGDHSQSNYRLHILIGPRPFHFFI